MLQEAVDVEDDLLRLLVVGAFDGGSSVLHKGVVLSLPDPAATSAQYAEQAAAIRASSASFVSFEELSRGGMLAHAGEIAPSILPVATSAGAVSRDATEFTSSGFFVHRSRHVAAPGMAPVLDIATLEEEAAVNASHPSRTTQIATAAKRVLQMALRETPLRHLAVGPACVPADVAQGACGTVAWRPHAGLVPKDPLFALPGDGKASSEAPGWRDAGFRPTRTAAFLREVSRNQDGTAGPAQLGGPEDAARPEALATEALFRIAAAINAGAWAPEGPSPLRHLLAHAGLPTRWLGLLRSSVRARGTRTLIKGMLVAEAVADMVEAAARRAVWLGVRRLRAELPGFDAHGHIAARAAVRASPSSGIPVWTAARGSQIPGQPGASLVEESLAAAHAGCTGAQVHVSKTDAELAPGTALFSTAARECGSEPGPEDATAFGLGGAYEATGPVATAGEPAAAAEAEAEAAVPTDVDRESIEWLCVPANHAEDPAVAAAKSSRVAGAEDLPWSAVCWLRRRADVARVAVLNCVFAGHQLPACLLQSAEGDAEAEGAVEALMADLAGDWTQEEPAAPASLGALGDVEAIVRAAQAACDARAPLLPGSAVAPDVRVSLLLECAGAAARHGPQVSAEEVWTAVLPARIAAIFDAHGLADRAALATLDSAVSPLGSPESADLRAGLGRVVLSDTLSVMGLRLAGRDEYANEAVGMAMVLPATVPRLCGTWAFPDITGTDASAAAGEATWEPFRAEAAEWERELGPRTGAAVALARLPAPFPFLSYANECLTQLRLRGAFGDRQKHSVLTSIEAKDAIVPDVTCHGRGGSIGGTRAMKTALLTAWIRKERRRVRTDPDTALPASESSTPSPAGAAGASKSPKATPSPQAAAAAAAAAAATSGGGGAIMPDGVVLGGPNGVSPPPPLWAAAGERPRACPAHHMPSPEAYVPLDAPWIGRVALGGERDAGMAAAANCDLMRVFELRAPPVASCFCRAPPEHAVLALQHAALGAALTSIAVPLGSIFGSLVSSATRWAGRKQPQGARFRRALGAALPVPPSAVAALSSALDLRTAVMASFCEGDFSCLLTSSAQQFGAYAMSELLSALENSPMVGCTGLTTTMASLRVCMAEQLAAAGDWNGAMLQMVSAATQLRSPRQGTEEAQAAMSVRLSRLLQRQGRAWSPARTGLSPLWRYAPLSPPQPMTPAEAKALAETARAESDGAKANTSGVASAAEPAPLEPLEDLKAETLVSGWLTHGAGEGVDADTEVHCAAAAAAGIRAGAKAAAEVRGGDEPTRLQAQRWSRGAVAAQSVGAAATKACGLLNGAVLPGHPQTATMLGAFPGMHLLVQQRGDGSVVPPEATPDATAFALSLAASGRAAVPVLHSVRRQMLVSGLETTLRLCPGAMWGAPAGLSGSARTHSLDATHAARLAALGRPLPPAGEEVPVAAAEADGVVVGDAAAPAAALHALLLAQWQCHEDLAASSMSLLHEGRVTGRFGENDAGVTLGRQPMWPQRLRCPEQLVAHASEAVMSGYRGSDSPAAALAFLEQARLVHAHQGPEAAAIRVNLLLGAVAAADAAYGRGTLASLVPRLELALDLARASSPDHPLALPSRRILGFDPYSAACRILDEAEPVLAAAAAAMTSAALHPDAGGDGGLAAGVPGVETVRSLCQATCTGLGGAGSSAWRDAAAPAPLRLPPGASASEWAAIAALDPSARDWHVAALRSQALAARAALAESPGAAIRAALAAVCAAHAPVVSAEVDSLIEATAAIGAAGGPEAAAAVLALPGSSWEAFGEILGPAGALLPDLAQGGVGWGLDALVGEEPEPTIFAARNLTNQTRVGEGRAAHTGGVERSAGWDAFHQLSFAFRAAARECTAAATTAEEAGGLHAGAAATAARRAASAYLRAALDAAGVALSLVKEPVVLEHRGLPFESSGQVACIASVLSILAQMDARSAPLDDEQGLLAGVVGGSLRISAGEAASGGAMAAAAAVARAAAAPWVGLDSLVGRMLTSLATHGVAAWVADADESTPTGLGMQATIIGTVVRFWRNAAGGLAPERALPGSDPPADVATSGLYAEFTGHGRQAAITPEGDDDSSGHVSLTVAAGKAAGVASSSSIAPLAAILQSVAQPCLFAVSDSSMFHAVGSTMLADLGIFNRQMTATSLPDATGEATVAAAQQLFAASAVAATRLAGIPLLSTPAELVTSLAKDGGELAALDAAWSAAASAASGAGDATGSELPASVAACGKTLLETGAVLVGVGAMRAMVMAAARGRGEPCSVLPGTVTLDAAARALPGGAAGVFVQRRSHGADEDAVAGSGGAGALGLELPVLMALGRRWQGSCGPRPTQLNAAMTASHMHLSPSGLPGAVLGVHAFARSVGGRSEIAINPGTLQFSGIITTDAVTDLSSMGRLSREDDSVSYPTPPETRAIAAWRLRCQALALNIGSGITLTPAVTQALQAEAATSDALGKHVYALSGQMQLPDRLEVAVVLRKSALPADAAKRGALLRLVGSLHHASTLRAAGGTLVHEDGTWSLVARLEDMRMHSPTSVANLLTRVVLAAAQLRGMLASVYDGSLREPDVVAKCNALLGLHQEVWAALPAHSWPLASKAVMHPVAEAVCSTALTAVRHACHDEQQLQLAKFALDSMADAAGLPGRARLERLGSSNLHIYSIPLPWMFNGESQLTVVFDTSKERLSAMLDIMPMPSGNRARYEVGMLAAMLKLMDRCTSLGAGVIARIQLTRRGAADCLSAVVGTTGASIGRAALSDCLSAVQYLRKVFEAEHLPGILEAGSVSEGNEEEAAAVILGAALTESPAPESSAPPFRVIDGEDGFANEAMQCLAAPAGVAACQPSQGQPVVLGLTSAKWGMSHDAVVRLYGQLCSIIGPERRPGAVAIGSTPPASASAAVGSSPAGAAASADGGLLIAERPELEFEAASGGVAEVGLHGTTVAAVPTLGSETRGTAVRLALTDSIVGLASTHVAASMKAHAAHVPQVAAVQQMTMRFLLKTAEGIFEAGPTSVSWLAQCDADFAEALWMLGEASMRPRFQALALVAFVELVGDAVASRDETEVWLEREWAAPSRKLSSEPSAAASSSSASASAAAADKETSLPCTFRLSGTGSLATAREMARRGAMRRAAQRCLGVPVEQWVVRAVSEAIGRAVPLPAACASRNAVHVAAARLAAATGAHPIFGSLTVPVMAAGFAVAVARAANSSNPGRVVAVSELGGSLFVAALAFPHSAIGAPLAAALEAQPKQWSGASVPVYTLAGAADGAPETVEAACCAPLVKYLDSMVFSPPGIAFSQRVSSSLMLSTQLASAPFLVTFGADERSLHDPTSATAMVEAAIELLEGLLPLPIPADLTGPAGADPRMLPPLAPELRKQFQLPGEEDARGIQAAHSTLAAAAAATLRLDWVSAGAETQRRFMQALMGGMCCLTAIAGMLPSMLPGLLRQSGTVRMAARVIAALEARILLPTVAEMAAAASDLAIKSGGTDEDAEEASGIVWRVSRGAAFVCTAAAKAGGGGSRGIPSTVAGVAASTVLSTLTHGAAPADFGTLILLLASSVQDPEKASSAANLATALGVDVASTLTCAGIHAPDTLLAWTGLPFSAQGPGETLPSLAQMFRTGPTLAAALAVERRRFGIQILLPSAPAGSAGVTPTVFDLAHAANDRIAAAGKPGAEVLTVATAGGGDSDGTDAARAWTLEAAAVVGTSRWAVAALPLIQSNSRLQRNGRLSVPLSISRLKSMPGEWLYSVYSEASLEEHEAFVAGLLPAALAAVAEALERVQRLGDRRAVLFGSLQERAAAGPESAVQQPRWNELLRDGVMEHMVERRHSNIGLPAVPEVLAATDAAVFASRVVGRNAPAAKAALSHGLEALIGAMWDPSNVELAERVLVAAADLIIGLLDLPAAAFEASARLPPVAPPLVVADSLSRGLSAILIGAKLHIARPAAVGATVATSPCATDAVCAAACERLSAMMAKNAEFCAESEAHAGHGVRVAVVIANLLEMSAASDAAEAVVLRHVLAPAVGAGVIEAVATLVHGMPLEGAFSSTLSRLLGHLPRAVELGVVAAERAKQAVEFARCAATPQLVQVVCLDPSPQNMESQTAAVAAAVALAALFPRAPACPFGASKLPPAGCLSDAPAAGDSAECARVLGRSGDTLASARTLSQMLAAVAALPAAADEGALGEFAARVWSSVLSAEALRSKSCALLDGGDATSFCEAGEAALSRELPVAALLPDADELLLTVFGSPYEAARAAVMVNLSLAGVAYAQPEYCVTLPDEQAWLLMNHSDTATRTSSKILRTAWEAIQGAASVEEAVMATTAAI